MNPTATNAPSFSKPVLWKEILILMTFTALAALGTHLWHPRAPAWFEQQVPLASDEVTLAMVAEKWRGEVLWIDARPRAAYLAGHVKGALLINEEEADQLLFENFEVLQDNRKPIVVYCDERGCQASRRMAAYLRERLPGMDIRVLRGRWQEWK